MVEINISKIKRPSINKEWALFYGIMLGDGCLCKHKRKNRKNSFSYFITVTGNCIDDRKFFDDVLKPLVIKLRGKQTKYRINKEHGRIDFNFSDIVLFKKINLLGFPIGKKNKLHIPRTFKKTINEVIAGLFATDGCLSIVNNNGTKYPRLIIKMTYKGLLKQVFNHLTNIGLKGNFYLAKAKQWPSNRKPQFWICFNGKENLIKFKNKIGFINPKQKYKYGAYLKYHADGRI